MNKESLHVLSNVRSWDAFIVFVSPRRRVTQMKLQLIKGMIYGKSGKSIEKAVI